MEKLKNSITEVSRYKFQNFSPSNSAAKQIYLNISSRSF